LTKIFQAEWAKLRRRGMILGGLGLLVGTSLLTVVLIFSSATDEAQPPVEGPPVPPVALLEEPGGIVEAFRIGGTLVGVVTLVRFAQSVGSEYGYGTLKVMLSYEPRRLRLLAAKLLAMSLFAIVGILLALIAQTIVVSFIASGRGIETADWWTAEGMQAVVQVTLQIIGAALGFGLIGNFLGVLFRSAAPAIGTGIGYLLVVESLLGIAWDESGEWLPGSLLQVVGDGGTPEVSLGRAVALSIVYAVAMTTAAAILFQTRDVTS
jgi:ABC-2 type transport system permease protein